MLENLGYQVCTAKDGAEGIKCLEGQEFDILLTDIQMPNVDGWELLRRIEGQYENMARGVVSADPITKEEKASSGVEYILRKPFLADKLSALVSQIMLDKDG